MSDLKMSPAEWDNWCFAHKEGKLTQRQGIMIELSYDTIHLEMTYGCQTVEPDFALVPNF